MPALTPDAFQTHRKQICVGLSPIIGHMPENQGKGLTCGVCQ